MSCHDTELSCFLKPNMYQFIYNIDTWVPSCVIWYRQSGARRTKRSIAEMWSNSGHLNCPKAASTNLDESPFYSKTLCWKRKWTQIYFPFSLCDSARLFFDDEFVVLIAVTTDGATGTVGMHDRCSSRRFDWTRCMRLKKSSSGTVGETIFGRLLRWSSNREL